jgi:arylsulfatase A-like enzyme
MPAVAYGNKSMGGFYELRDYLDYADAPSPFERPLTEEQQRELRHGYYASVSFIDAQIGRLLEALEILDLTRKTIVVLWSDHGWKLGEHGGWGKQTNFDIDTRVPLIIRVPGSGGNGQVCRALVELVDLYPTLCELAGVPIPPALEGRSLAPVLADPTRTFKDAAFSQFPRRHEGFDYMGYAVRTERYRYVEWVDKLTAGTVARELYDAGRDPEENINLAGVPEQSAVVRDLSERLWRGFARPVAKR